MSISFFITDHNAWYIVYPQKELDEGKEAGTTWNVANSSVLRKNNMNKKITQMIHQGRKYKEKMIVKGAGKI